MSNPNNCATCWHRANPGDGWCHMFQDEPHKACLRHAERRSCCYGHTMGVGHSFGCARIARPPAPTAPPCNRDRNSYCQCERKAMMCDGVGPAPTAQPAAPLLFIAMDDDKRASVTWCANEAAVREAAKRSMFWLQPGEQLSAEHANELDGCVEELLDSGAMNFEGDPPLHLYRVGSVAQPVQQPSAEPIGWLSRTKYQVREAVKAFPGESHDYLWRYTHGTRDLEDAEREPQFEVVRVYTQAAPAQRQPLTPSLRRAAEFTRADLGPAGSNYPHVRELLAFAEQALGITAAPAAQKGEPT